MRRVVLVCILASLSALAAPVVERLKIEQGDLHLVWGKVQHGPVYGEYTKYLTCKAQAKIEGFADKNEVQRIQHFQGSSEINDRTDQEAFCKKWASEQMKALAEALAKLGTFHSETRKTMYYDGKSFAFLKICYHEDLQVVYQPTENDYWFIDSFAKVKRFVECPNTSRKDN